MDYLGLIQTIIVRYLDIDIVSRMIKHRLLSTRQIQMLTDLEKYVLVSVSFKLMNESSDSHSYQIIRYDQYLKLFTNKRTINPEIVELFEEFYHCGLKDQEVHINLVEDRDLIIRFLCDIGTELHTGMDLFKLLSWESGSNDAIPVIIDENRKFWGTNTYSPSDLFDDDLVDSDTEIAVRIWVDHNYHDDYGGITTGSIHVIRLHQWRCFLEKYLDVLQNCEYSAHVMGELVGYGYLDLDLSSLRWDVITTASFVSSFKICCKTNSLGYNIFEQWTTIKKHLDLQERCYKEEDEYYRTCDANELDSETMDSMLRGGIY
jgi:hypothetical protein